MTVYIEWDCYEQVLVQSAVRKLAKVEYGGFVCTVVSHVLASVGSCNLVEALVVADALSDHSVSILTPPLIKYSTYLNCNLTDTKEAAASLLLGAKCAAILEPASR